jgi:asparagine synthetase B (glutamine-hydrolysing)
MCGLFGALSSSLSKKEVENVCFLGLLSATRGTDSTGLAVLGRGKGRFKIATARELGNSMNFLLGKEAKRVLDTDNRFCIMGHTRWATLGAVNLYNAHPIEEDGIVLCHNGSIDHFLQDKKDEEDSDSRELARRLSKDNKLEGVLRSVGSGAYACTWFDFRSSTINLVRNAQKPLSFMYSKAHDTLYWASEYWMLKALSFKEGDNNFEKPEFFATDRHWSFPFTSAKGKVTILDLFPAPEKGGHILPLPPPKKVNEMFCRFCKKLDDHCICGDNVASVPLVNSEFKSMLYRGFNNSTLSIAAVAPRLKSGCASCKKPASPRDSVYWFHQNEFVCKECREDNPVVEEYLIRECKVYESSLVRTN